MRQNYFLGLPPIALNILSLGWFFILVCLGIRIVRASDLALNVANAQLITSTSVTKLDKLTARLNEQAQLIRDKDEAYQELRAIYEQSLKQANGYERLKNQIEQIETIPQPDDIDAIELELSETKTELLKVSQ